MFSNETCFSLIIVIIAKNVLLSTNNKRSSKIDLQVGYSYCEISLGICSIFGTV